MKIIIFCVLAAFVLAVECSRDLASATSTEVDVIVKNTVWFPNVEIFSFSGELTKGNNASATECDKWCFDYKGCRSWTYYRNGGCSLYSIVVPITLPSIGSWTGMYVK